MGRDGGRKRSCGRTLAPLTGLALQQLRLRFGVLFAGFMFLQLFCFIHTHETKSEHESTDGPAGSGPTASLFKKNKTLKELGDKLSLPGTAPASPHQYTSIAR